MAQQFLFVLSAQPTDTPKQKELLYAATKAHIQRNVHRNRRRGLREQKQIPKADIQHLPDSSANRLIQTSKDVSSDEVGFSRSRLRSFTVSGSPCPAPWLGNSDPFACQLFPVTPLMNQTISFARFHITRSWSPSIMLRIVSKSTRYCPLLGSFGSTVGLRAADFLWELLASDVGTFWSVVASVVPLMISVLPEQATKDIREVTFLLKARSLVLIREALSRAEDPSAPSTVLIYQIKALFREACMSGDIQAARSHAKILRYLTQQLPASNDFQRFRVALWSDALPALLQLRRPVLSQLEWMPEMLARTWQLAEAVLPSSALLCTHLPDCIRDPTLRAAILHIRHALYIGNVSMQAEYETQIQRAEVIFHWITSKAEFHMNCLLNLYFDLLTPDADPLHPLTLGERYTSAAMALALLHILQRSFCDLTQSDGIDLHDTAAILHPPLLTSTQLALSHSSDHEKVIFSKIHFWIVFVGAYCEERFTHFAFSSNNARTNSSEHRVQQQQQHTWFHTQLHNMASLMGLSKWSEAKLVLGQFVLDDYLEPKAEVWFEATTIGEIND